MNSKNPIFGPFPPHIWGKKFSKNLALSRTTPYGHLIPCLVSEKTNEPIARKRPDRKTERRTEPNSYDNSGHWSNYGKPAIWNLGWRFLYCFWSNEHWDKNCKVRNYFFHNEVAMDRSIFLLTFNIIAKLRIFMTRVSSFNQRKSKNQRTLSMISWNEKLSESKLHHLDS